MPVAAQARHAARAACRGARAATEISEGSGLTLLKRTATEACLREHESGSGAGTGWLSLSGPVTRTREPGARAGGVEARGLGMKKGQASNSQAPGPEPPGPGQAGY